MADDVQIVVSPDVYLIQIQNLKNEISNRDAKIHDLEVMLQYERSLREQSNHLIIETTKGDSPVAKSHSSKKRDVTPDTNTYSDFKSDGKRKAHPADSIRSYDDFKAMQDYFLGKNSVRDWAMWTIGVSLGLRVSDLLSLRFRHFIEDDKLTIKPRIEIYEQKTGKLNNLLITEAVQNALITYLRSIKFSFDLDGYLFASKKTGDKMYEEHGWRILSTAGRAIGLPIVIGSHTMRKSFANIAACVDKSCIDMNSITKVQGLLNHSDQRVTMKYLGAYQDMFDRARIAVSDFVLGKSGVNEIIAGNQYTVDDIMGRLEALEEYLATGKEPR